MSLNQVSSTALCVFVVMVNFFIYLPIGFYFTLKFWKLRDQTFIKKRRPVLVIISIVFIFLWMLGVRTVDIYGGLFPISTDPFSRHLLVLITDTGWLCVNAYVLRMWLLYYDYKKGVDLSSMRWKKK
eukprot:837552_1